MLSSHPLGDLGVTYGYALHLPVENLVVDFIFVIIELFRYLLRLIRYKRKSAKVGVFRRRVNISANISGGRGQLPATLVRAERL